MSYVLASAVGMLGTDTEAVRRANAQILIDQAAANATVKLDGIYPIQLAVLGPAMTGSVAWIGDDPEVSGLVFHGAGSEINVFRPTLSRVYMRNITIRSRLEDDVQQYRIFTTGDVEGGDNQTLGVVDVERCVFGNIAFLDADHTGVTSGNRGFTSWDMHDCTIRNLVRTMFVQAVQVPWGIVRLSGIRQTDCQMHTFYIQGTRPVLVGEEYEGALAGPVYASNMWAVNTRGPKPAINTGTYYCQLFASDCEAVIWDGGYTEGYSTYRENSNCTSVFARGQRVVVKNDTTVNCVSVDRRNALIDVKNGYAQGSPEAGGGELTRHLENITAIVEEPYLESIFDSYVRADFWQSPWIIPDNIDTREANGVTIKNVTIRAPHIHSRYSFSTPGDLTVEGLTLDCELFTAQLTGGLFTLEAGPNMRQINISNSRLIQRGATVTEYPLIRFRTDPGEAVKVIAYNNKLDGCLTQDNELEPAPAVQPLAVYQFEVEGSQMVTQSSIDAYAGASFDVLIPCSLPSGESRELRWYLGTTNDADPILAVLGESGGIVPADGGARLTLGATTTAGVNMGALLSRDLRWWLNSAGGDADDVVRIAQGPFRLFA